ncbi:lipoprotein-attachment site-containing protein [Polynucleobacter meluiroseus]|uniref:Lipoprotein-attachment site-containing protein n=1 Tax=Polynucleobacter meluiroseus TaxID=1938814 RepID=A0A240E1Z6_9BURK|nr:lipoprotein [Polynucleobacter meluiroseus]SNX28880.1 lipoprotein-attachment site-containing protein [Polynucleobacter meluiroseus]
MIAILKKTLPIALLIALAGCGVRGPLYLPNVPPAPAQPTEPEPKGTLYPVQGQTTTNSPAASK